jgi:TPP-dependent pyruvate/acetoin dehydrogenase alpha subunit
MEPSRETLGWMGENFLLIETFDRKVRDLYRAKMLPVGPSLSASVALTVGGCGTLEPNDYVTPSGGRYGQCLARGADPNKVMADIFLKGTGYCKGKGGRILMCAPEVGVFMGKAILGNSLPIAAGLALSIKLRKSRGVTLSFFGDGESCEGTFHEALNFASLQKLPVVYICEHNNSAGHSDGSKLFPIEDFTLRGKAYGMQSQRINGDDIFEVYGAVREAVKRARDGMGPTFIDAVIQGSHLSSLKDERSPASDFVEKLVARNVFTESEVGELKRRITQRVDEAVQFARQSPYPEAEELFKDVFIAEG